MPFSPFLFLNFNPRTPQNPNSKNTFPFPICSRSKQERTLFIRKPERKKRPTLELLYPFRDFIADVAIVAKGYKQRRNGNRSKY